MVKNFISSMAHLLQALYDVEDTTISWVFSSIKISVALNFWF